MMVGGSTFLQPGAPPPSTTPDAIAQRCTIGSGDGFAEASMGPAQISGRGRTCE